MATHSLKRILHEIGYTVSEMLPSSRTFAKHSRLIGVGFLAIVAATGSYFGYRWYASSQERAAQALFATYEQDYILAANANNSEEWNRIAGLFEYGYTKNSGSSLAPYFLLYQSDAQLKQGDRANAIATLEKASKLASSSPFAYLIDMKRSLIMLDDADEAVRQKGLDILIELARNKSSKFHDAALFYLGRYYAYVNKQDDAQKAWQELVDEYVVDTASPSPWVYEAKARLKQFSN